MRYNPKNTPNDRRGFLRSLLGLEDPVLTAKQKALEKRAGLLAFKHAKDVEKLLKLGVQAPVHIEEARYSVKVSGQNESGDALALHLEVDAESEVVARIEAENSTT